MASTTTRKLIQTTLLDTTSSAHLEGDARAQWLADCQNTLRGADGLTDAERCILAELRTINHEVAIENAYGRLIRRKAA